MKINPHISKISFLFLLVISSGQILFCQNKSIGYWSGIMLRDGNKMNVSFEFGMQNNLIVAHFNSPSQMASGIPLDSVSLKKDSLSFQLMTSPASYFKCLVTEKNITGKIIQDGFSEGGLYLEHSHPPNSNFTYADTLFESGSHVIACRVYYPKAKGKFPAVVFIHGSGGEGMFANQFIAEYLASKGIVALIQDKQGVGKSTGDWKTAGFDDLAVDYVNAVEFLKTSDKVNQSQIGIYGHSQGGTISPLVASKSKYISFIIAAAAIADSVYKQDLYRVENNLKSNDFTIDEIREAMTYYKSWLNMARTGNGFEKLDSLNKISKSKKWFDFVTAPPKDHWIWKYYLKTGNYNSLVYWQNIKIPVLLVYGQDDQIEDINSYIKQIDESLIERGNNRDVTQIILPQAQHNLCIFPNKNDKFFWWHISPGYLDLLVSWILLRFNNSE